MFKSSSSKRALAVFGLLGLMGAVSTSGALAYGGFGGGGNHGGGGGHWGGGHLGGGGHGPYGGGGGHSHWGSYGHGPYGGGHRPWGHGPYGSHSPWVSPHWSHNNWKPYPYPHHVWYPQHGCGYWNHWCNPHRYQVYNRYPVYVTPKPVYYPKPTYYSAPTYRAPSYAPSYSAPVVRAYAPPAPPSTCVPGGTYIVIVFQENATSGTITAFLKEYNVAISDGPNADGMYRIRLSTEAGSTDKYSQMIDSMRSRQDVVKSIDS